MGRLGLAEGLGVHGHFKLTTRDAVTQQIHEEREADNLITSAGLTAIANAVGFALTANQNGGWGGSVAASTGNLSNSWGAVGNSSTAVTAGDIALGNEIGRALVVASGLISANATEVEYFFGTGMGNGTITEGGVFTNAAYLPATLSAALTNLTSYSTMSVSPYLVVDNLNNPTALPTGSFLQLNYGGGNTQYVQTTAPVAYGATSIAFAAVGGGTFTTTSTYPVGTKVVYGPNGTGQPNPPVNGGLLFDHAVFSVPITKTNLETATLGLQLTVTSV